MTNIRQGAIHWIDFSPSKGSELKGCHPAIILQASHINQTAINTTVVIGITSNIRLKDIPGNLFLKKGEGSLPKDSVANVSQLHTIDKTRVGEKLGNLSHLHLHKIFQGIDLLFDR